MSASADTKLIMAEKGEMRGIVRFIDKDVNGILPIRHALTRVKGVSFMMARAICTVLKQDPMEQIGYMSQESLDKITECAKNPLKFGIPKWMLNHRKDLETGEDVHYVSNDLDLSKKSDVRFMQKIKSYKGVRHSMGSKKVRGQRTRTGARKKKGALGVKRRKDAKAGK